MPRAVRPSWPGSSVRLLSVGLGGAVAFVVLSVLVATGTTQGLDDSVRQMFRPDDVWGTNQVVFGNVVDGLGPPVVTGLLLVTGLVSATRARSPRPMVLVVLLAVVTLAETSVSKAVVHRADPHGGMTGIGGAFPSGHMVTLLVSLGGVLLVLGAHTHWRAWGAVALVGLAMAASLLFLATHWFSDVFGGALLAVPTLALACLAWRRDEPRRGVSSNGSGARISPSPGQSSRSRTTVRVDANRHVGGST